MKEPFAPERPYVWAQGQVLLTGRVIEGTDGYRAQRAMIQGSLSLVFGRGERPSCMAVSCQETATWVRTGPTMYLLRCGTHAAFDKESGYPRRTLAEFHGACARGFRYRYDVNLEEG